MPKTPMAANEGQGLPAEQTILNLVRSLQSETWSHGFKRPNGLLPVDSGIVGLVNGGHSL